MNKKSIWYLVVLLAVVWLVGSIVYICWDNEEDDDDEQESTAPYRTITIALQDYTYTREFTAKIETEQPAEIRPQISGRLTKICVKEGALVKRGQPLFIIDQTPYLAAVRSAEAWGSAAPRPSWPRPGRTWRARSSCSASMSSATST